MTDRAPTAGDAARLEGLVAALPDAVVVINADAQVVWCNPAAERLMGRTLDHWRGRNALVLVHADDVALAAASMESVQGKAVGTPIELRVRSGDNWRLVELIGAPLANGEVVLCLRDLTERRRWEVAGNEVDKFRALVHNAAALMLLLRPDGTVEAVSGVITRALGHDQEAVEGKALEELVVPEDAPVVRGALRRATSALATRQRGPVTVDVRMRRSNGGSTPYELTIVSLLDDPTVEGVVVTGHDISRLRATQDALSLLASSDALTGLPNGRTFRLRLEAEWASANREGTDSVVVVTDLDGFKELNDSRGHHAGDEALKQFATILRRTTRDSDIVGRLGGDEFGVVLVGSEGSADAFEQRLRAQLSWDGAAHDHNLEVTVGCATLNGSASAADALHAADLAMLARKAERRAQRARPGAA